MENAGESARILLHWRDECDSAALYEGLARIVGDPHRSRVFTKLAQSERAHAQFWAERAKARGLTLPVFRQSLRTRVLIRLAATLGVAFVLPHVAMRERADRARYEEQADAMAAGLSQGERGHAAVLRRIAAYASASDQTGRAAVSAGLANNLRAAVLGANDGLASNFCLMMGVIGGGAAATTVVLTGVAGLVAGACAMALGEWLSITNAREMAQGQMDGNGPTLQSPSAWTRTGLALVYEAGGLSEEDAARAAERVLAEEPEAIRALIREEGLLAAVPLAASPVSAAAYSFVLFAVGAAVPLLPFAVASSKAGILQMVAASLLALLMLGLLTSFFNGRAPLWSGLRQVLVGAGAAAVTYGAGRIVGAVVS